MYFVYAIQSAKDGRIYVGMCADISARLKEHNAGKTKSTKGFKPWKLIYKEELPNRIEARKREIYLKSGIGKEFLKSLVP
jgi:putative endonuclease